MITSLLEDEAVQTLLKLCVAHPFNRQLADGTLPLTQFLEYLNQDSHYLVDFARGLALVGARSPEPERLALLLEFAQGALSERRSLHQTLLPEATQGPPNSSCLGYTRFILSHARQAPVEVSWFALLPCFWIYREVGISLGVPRDNPYRSWIEVYASPNYSASVDRALALGDALLGAPGSRIRRRQREAFLSACAWEWRFWNAAGAPDDPLYTLDTVGHGRRPRKI